MTRVLFEEQNPNGNLTAIVEVDERVCYLYLFGPEIEFDTCAVWVRNLAEAPEAQDVGAMAEGVPPMARRADCRMSSAQPVPDADDLSFVWLPEGNGVALYEGKEALALIPPWSGQDGFCGFARDAVGDGSFAWELTSDNILLKRFADAAEYWKAWDQEPWPDIQKQQMSCVEMCLGEHSNYYAIDGGSWPPKALIRIPRQDQVVLISIGVSLRPQPNVEMSVKEPLPHRRFEMAVVLPATWSEESIGEMGSYISGQCRYPWNGYGYTWFGHGHTVHCDRWQNPKFNHALLMNSHPAVPQPFFDNVFDEPVNLLWLLPITEPERDLAVKQTSAELLSLLPENRWQEA